MDEKITLEIEKAIAAAILMDGNSLPNVADIISADDFTDNDCREIFKTAKRLADEGKNADLISVSQALSGKVSLNAILEISNSVTTTVNLMDHAQMLREIADKRNIWRLCATVSQQAKAATTTADELRETLQSYLQGECRDVGARAFRDITKDVNNIVSNNLAGKQEYGVNIGYRFIDQQGGFSLSDLVIIGGDTSQGKTAFSLSIAMNLALSGIPVAFYSLEMTATQLAARLFAMDSGVKAQDITTRPLPDADLEKFDKSVTRLCNIPLYVDERSTSRLDGIMSSIRRLVRRYGIKTVFVDYLQILGVGDRGQNREQQLADTARKLKNLAKDLNIVIVALSQLNRDKDTPEPSKDRIRDSAQIVDACDCLMLVYRPECYGRSYTGGYANVDTHNTGLIKVEKMRNGSIGGFIVGFTPEIVKFYELEQLPDKRTSGNYFDGI